MFRCLWCPAAFETQQGAKAHMRAKHRRNMPVKEEDWQAYQLERYHRELTGQPTGKLHPARKVSMRGIVPQ